MDKNGKRKSSKCVADNKRDAIRAFLQAGKTYREIANILGVSKSTVGNVAKEACAVDSSVVAAIKKTELETLKAKSKMLLEGLTPEKVAKAPLNTLAVSYGILFDKRRLIAGKSTSNQSIAAIIKAAHGIKSYSSGHLVKPEDD